MTTLLATSRQTRAWPKWSRYAGATGLALIAFAAQMLLREEIPPQFFLAYFPAILFAVTLFGGNPAVWSVSFSAGLSGYFLFEPRGFAISDPVDALTLVLFIATALLLVFVVDELYRAFDRLDAEATRTKEALTRAIEAGRLEALLAQEMAHRTKNDLQFLSSMLQIEGRALEPGGGRASLLAAASRISVVGRVHSLLQRGGPPLADMKPLIDELCADLQVSLVGVRPVALRAEVEPCVLPLETARSTALIVNELVTNALKHAFPDERPGTVKIRLAREQSETVLIVEDDGIGLPPAPPSRAGFGQKLVRSLAQQLGGGLTIRAEPTGTRCELRFPAPPI
jgi:two-component sensor histidine kinase